MSQILVVDDDAAIRRALARYLEADRRFQVFLAEDGVEAMAVLEREHVAFALIDLHMPRMSGIELVDRCDQEFPEVLYVVMSGYEEVIVQANQKLRLQPVLLRKPFELRQLDGLLAGALKGELWARVQAMGPHHLRRGGWYELDHDITDDIDVRVKLGDRFRRARRGVVTLAGRRPLAWSIVQQDLSIPLPPAALAMGERYGVCPNCRYRSVLPTFDAEFQCPDCRRTFAVHWDDALQPHGPDENATDLDRR